MPKVLPSRPHTPTGVSLYLHHKWDQPSKSYEQFIFQEIPETASANCAENATCPSPSEPTLQLHESMGQKASGDALICASLTACEGDHYFMLKCQFCLLSRIKIAKLFPSKRVVWEEGAYRVYSDPTTRAYSAPTPRRSQADTRSFSSVCSC